MIGQGEELVSILMVGEMGIKTARIGVQPVLERPGGYVYLQLETKEGE